MNHAVILAINKIRNRSQLTYNRSHIMLPALGKPVIARIMERLYRIGIREFTVILGETEGAIAAYLNSQWLPDVKINWTFHLQTANLMTTMREIAQQINAPFIVSNYNYFTHNRFPERLIRKHRESPNDLIFSGALHTLSQTSYLNLATVEQNQIVQIHQNSTLNHSPANYILGDLFICGTMVVDYLKSASVTIPSTDNPQFLDIAQKYLDEGGKGLMAESNWILQIEADRDLLTLSKMLLDEGQDAHILSELPYTVKITPPVRIDPQVSVGQGAKIGPHVYLERGSSVGHEAVLKNSIVLTQCNVPSGRTLINTILTTRGPIN